ncbi:hypothetical protein O6P43_008603 [Quillaja saponaria]|uniref:Uncharacterized protein n=1 Tax=Quillaja saponaria TaxID=32244 RepID=A0AAD7M7Q3_QUISA|nr:hypothetical protein O6P43_008603 [Quillaja saponaria]
MDDIQILMPHGQFRLALYRRPTWTLFFHIFGRHPKDAFATAFAVRLLQPKALNIPQNPFPFRTFRRLVPLTTSLCSFEAETIAVACGPLRLCLVFMSLNSISVGNLVIPNKNKFHRNFVGDMTFLSVVLERVDAVKSSLKNSKNLSSPSLDEELEVCTLEKSSQRAESPYIGRSQRERASSASYGSTSSIKK